MSAAPLETGEAGEFDYLARIPRPRVVASELADHLADRELRLRGELKDDSDPGPPVPAGLGRVHAEHRNRAAVPVAVTLEDLHSGGLAGPVRPQQCEHLATADLQVDAVDGDGGAVALA